MITFVILKESILSSIISFGVTIFQYNISIGKIFIIFPRLNYLLVIKLLSFTNLHRNIDLKEVGM